MFLACAAAALIVVGCGAESDGGGRAAAKGTPAPKADPPSTLVVYSGRPEALIGELMKDFTDRTGLELDIRYGESRRLAEAILREGPETGVDIFISEGAGALGMLRRAELLDMLLRDIADPPSQWAGRSYWVGMSGRARTIAFNPRRIDEAKVPDSVLGLDRPKYAGRVGWAPGALSFQDFVSGLRWIEGDLKARRWLLAMRNNDTHAYEDEAAVRDAVATGEIDFGLIDLQQILQAGAEQGRSYPVAARRLADGDIGGLIDVAGVGQLTDTNRRRNGERLIRYLLAKQGPMLEEAQEYPIVTGLKPEPDLAPLAEIEDPVVHVADLDDLSGTLDMLREVGIL